MQKKHPPSAPARYLLWAIQLAAAKGVDGYALAADCGLERAQLEALDGMLPARQFDAVLHRLLQAAGGRELGFELGMHLQVSSHDILGYAFLSSETLGQSMRLAQRYYRLITPNFRLQYEARGDEVELLFTPAQPMAPETLYFYEEAIAVATYRHMCSLLQKPLSNCRIMLSMQQPPHAARYRELGAVQVGFGASPLPGIRIIAPAALMEERLPLANGQALDTAEQLCRRLMQHVREESSFKDWVGMMLNAAVDYQPRLEELAGILNIAARTLDRYLRKEGTTFRALALAIRNRRAQEMLLEQRLPISQIAYRLGYTDVANFGHAFRKLNGCAPSDYRKSGGV